MEGADYDVDNNGTLDSFPATVIDAIGWSDGGVGDIVYGGVLLTQAFGVPQAATRFPAALTPLSASAWYNGVLTGSSADVAYGLNVSANFPAGGVLTPGDVNQPIPDLIFADGFDP